MKASSTDKEDTKKLFSHRIKQLIKAIPYGKVATYGQIASHAGNSRASRQVAWILHSSSKKDGLPWHRVINSKGRISLPPQGGYEVQKKLLEIEGIAFKENGSIDLDTFLWRISSELKMK
jgi:methylated-DNA-protein-cysteine methyltransferase-like protein